MVPPVPIPNTEVKRCSPNGSASLGCARVGRRQNYEPRPVKAGRGSLVFGSLFNSSIVLVLVLVIFLDFFTASRPRNDDDHNQEFRVFIILVLLSVKTGPSMGQIRKD